LNVTGANGLTVRGVISGGGNLTKSGPGSLILFGANTYTGGTTVNAGTLEIQNSGALGGNPAGTNVASGATLAFSGNISSIDNLTLIGSGVGGLGSLRNLSGSNTSSGTIALDATLGAFVGVSSGSTLTSTGVISGGGSVGFTKTGDGTLVLNSTSANTYTATTAITAGTLEIRRSDSLGVVNTTTLVDGTTLRLNGNALSVAENITITGTGFGANTGAIQNTGGNNSLTGTVNMTGNSAIASDTGNTLTVSGAVVGTGFNLVKTGDGGLTLCVAAMLRCGCTTAC
jgi:autotransporter-associated beta strand protein